MIYKAALLLTLVLLLSAIPGGAALSAEPNDSTAPLESSDLAAFADAFFAETMDALKVPGAAVVVVRGSEVLLSRGYGQADTDRKAPVDADTVFRAGSVSKLFTATAVMQLVEQGRLDLQADVNNYLQSFQLETQFPGPVTVADLLLHTAGYDEESLGSHARSAAEGLPLGEFLAENMSPQTAPAGEFISYNDLTMSLAGFLVEEVSGVPFEQYVAQNILQPLGMDSSTFVQPAPQPILDRLAVGYALNGSDFSPFAYDYINVGPAAALLTTAGDMGHFLSAHLTGGAPLMNPETLSEMHATQFRMHEKLRGRTYGFSELFVNGRRVIFHDGGNPGFGNRLMLLPEEGVGFFITFNMDQSDPGGKLHRAFTSAFFDRYFPAEDAFVPPLPADITYDPARYTGYYREMQAYSSRTIQKLTSLLNQFPVTTTADGSLRTAGSTMIPVEKDLFAWADTDGYVAFREDEGGKISHMFFGTGVFVKLKWYESQPFHMALAGLFVLVFLGSLVGAFLPVFGRMHTLLRPLLGLTGLLNLAFLLVFAYVLMQTSQWEFAYGIPTAVKWLLAVPFVTLLLTAAIAVLTFNIGSGGGLNGFAGVFLVVFLFVSAVYYGFLSYWNLLGWRA